MVNVFLFLPSSEPVYQWEYDTESLQDEILIVEYFRHLKSSIDSIFLENYQGYYDSFNISSFLKEFEEIEDCYPNPSFRLLRSFLKDWENWQENQNQRQENTYLIHEQNVTNHTFCETAQLTIDNPQLKNVILNLNGHKLGNEIIVFVNDTSTKTPCVSNSNELISWFAEERLPQRNFHIIDKHGENRDEVRIINNEVISPLRCSRNEAQKLLKYAIGDNLKELYNFDKNKNSFIVFKFEGQTPQNLYHGYHLPIDTNEISETIKTKLTKD